MTSEHPPGPPRAPGPAVATTRLWLCDFDNTLAPLEPNVDWAASRRALEAMLLEAGVAQRLFDEYPKRNLLLFEGLREWLEAEPPDRNGHDVSPRLLARASAIIEHYELAGVAHTAPAPGALELLASLHAAGRTVIVVTSNSSRTVTRWLELHGVAGYVKAIMGRDSLLPLKPSPATIIRACELGAALPAEAAMVGDSAADQDAARAAGVAFYGIATTPAAGDQLRAGGALEVFASPAALQAWLGLPPLANRTPAAESGRC